MVSGSDLNNMPRGIYLRTEEIKNKLKVPHPGSGKYPKSQEFKDRQREIQLKRVRDGKHNMYLKDRSKLRRYIGCEEKRSPAYKAWRREICNRDKWKCRFNNNECRGKLEVHHIFNWKDYIELRFIINNGITLCHFHHPRKREEEKRMIPIFQELLSVSSE